jgi:hypothetical protein
MKLPSKRICQKFSVTYDLKGCQKAVDFLAQYYGIRRMKIILDGKRVGKKYVAYYEKNVTRFKIRGLTKRIVLHEFYHHIANSKGFDITLTEEEKQARLYSRNFMQKIIS